MENSKPLAPANRSPLSASHFRPAGQESLAQHGLVARLTAKLAEAFASALGGFGTAAPRVTFDGISDGPSVTAEEGGTWLRFESRNGSMSVQIILDRPMVFAMCELALGGTGTEEPVTGLERPFSAIEKELRMAVVSALANAAAAALSQVLGAPFSLFENAVTEGVSYPSAARNQVGIRYLVNIFSYSGELRLSMPQSELAAQLGALDKPSGDGEAREVQRSVLQRQISGATASFQISLAPEMVRVEDILGLRPGGLLRLAATMNTPVVVSSGGTKIFSAALVHSVDRLAVRLTEAVP